MPIDEKGIRQAQSHEAASRLRELDCPLKGGEGPGRVEQVALDVHPRGLPGKGLLDGGGVDHDACAQIGRHRPARVVADQHQALARADIGGAMAQHAPDTDRPEVDFVLGTEQVWTHGPHEGRMATQRRQADGRVGGRSSGHLETVTDERGDLAIRPASTRVIAPGSTPAACIVGVSTWATRSTIACPRQTTSTSRVAQLAVPGTQAGRDDLGPDTSPDRTR